MMDLEYTNKRINSKRGSASILAIILVFLAGKFKWIIGLLKIAKIQSLLTIFLSLWAYAVIYGWKFGGAIIYQLFIHEMGHLIAAKKKKVPTTPAFFIPFVGAVVGLKEMPKNAKDEAYIAYAGPLFGLMATLPAGIIYYFTQSPFWGVVLYLGALLNLFNLIPLSPLDGGRIISALSPKIWFFGLLILLVYCFYDPSFLLIYLFMIGVFSWIQHYREGFLYDLCELKLAGYEKMKLDLQEYHERLKNYLSIQNEREKLVNQLKELKAEKERKRIPWIEDTEIKMQAMYEVQYDFALEKYRLADHYRINYLTGEPYEEANMEAVYRRIENSIDKLKEEQKRLKTYYKTDAKTKWLTLFAYLLIVAVFALLAYGGIMIMEKHPPGSL